VQRRSPSDTGRQTGASALALALAGVAAVASLSGLLRPDVLHGPAAMIGSARGTALVVLFAGVPLLVGAVFAARRGSALASLVWLGSLGMLAYNAVMFLFATPFNSLFLLYVAWLALSIWSIGLLLSQLDVQDLAARFARSTHRRGVAGYIWVVVGLNAVAWLGQIVPGLAQSDRPAFLRGTGLPTSVVFVQDLAIWLPLMAVVGWWLWRDRPWGVVAATAGLVMWVLESISVAVDQAYGAAADPSSPVASAALVPAFAALAVVGVVPILLLLAGFEGEGLVAKARTAAPAPDRRTPWAWALALVTCGVAAFALWGGVALVHDGFGMPASWLTGTPFTTWAWPGMLLIVGVALPNLVVAGLVVAHSSWARLAGLLSGGLLVAWIAVQLVVLQHTFFLQPVVVAIGAAEIWLAGRWRSPRRPSWAAERSGVVFTVDPLDGNPHRLVVVAVLGDLKAVASGTAAPDVYVLQRDPLHIVSVTVGHPRTTKFVTGRDHEDRTIPTTDDEQDERVLTGQQIVHLAHRSEGIQEQRRTPQAVEWAMDAHGAWRFASEPWPSAAPSPRVRLIADTLEGLVVS
jgi:Pyruvate phosphate dikinase, AMP/ATP-binding domain